MIDPARHMSAVAELLLGKPNPTMSSDGEWRYGSHGSLSIKIEAGTFYDHERGEGGGVLDLISREHHCNRAAAMKWLLENIDAAAGEPAEAERVNGHAKPKLGRQVASYDYINEHGELVLQVVRFEPKDFRQRRPDPSAPDGWNWKIKGVVEPIPYHLAKLREAKAVVICEGEKDCNRLAGLGFVATTNPGGVKKWPTNFARWFAGKNVAIIPDNDQAGRDHAEAVARNIAGQVSALKIVPLPGLLPKGDVSDWLDAGGTADALRALIKAAPHWAPPAGPGADVDDDRPVIRVTLGGLPAAVAASNPPARRGSSRHVRPRRRPCDAGGRRRRPADGTGDADPDRPRDCRAASRRFERIARVTEQNGPEWREGICDPRR